MESSLLMFLNKETCALQFVFLIFCTASEKYLQIRIIDVDSNKVLPNLNVRSCSEAKQNNL